MKAAELFVKALENEGVKYVFGVPGEENLDILEAFRKSNIKFVVTRHEQAAGFMAATIGRLTGKAGVCLSTLGPGATNLVTAAAYAQLGGMPMLMITGQKPIKKSKQGSFQIIDVVGMMRPITKMTKQITTGVSIPSLVRQAFKLAEEERPGAVHLELPEDIAAEELSDEHVYPAEKAGRPLAWDLVLDAAVKMIEEAKSPLLLIGAGANRKMVQKALSEFVEKTGIFFFNTQMGKGVIDERHPLYLGTAALSDHDYLHCAIARSDLIINVGHDVIEKPPFLMSHEDKRKVIHVNFSAAVIDPIYHPQLEVVGDIANSITKLSEKINRNKEWNFEYFKKVKAEVEKHILEKNEDEGFPLKPQRIVADVRRVMPEDGIVTLDNGMYKVWFARNYKAYSPNTLLLDNALASMGAGLASAIATKLIFPDKKVLSVCGDGGFMMNSQELETAIRLGIDLVILIVNDGAYGMIKWKQEAMGMQNFGLEYGNPDFKKYAESYGARAYKIEKTADFAKVLNEALNSKGVSLVEVPIDYSENLKVLSKELAEKTCVL